MVKRNTRKMRRVLRRKSRVNKSKGGGWSDGPDFVNPGNLVHHQYSGPGKDCTGNPESIRPGHIDHYSPHGLPGLKGGKRLRKRRGGQLIENKQDPAVTSKPGWFPDTTGVGGTVSAPGVPPKAAQMGGRYGFFPEMGPLNPINGVGVTPAPFGRIPCESGTYNPLNPDPNGIQTMTTAPSQPPYVTMKGGAGFPVVNVGAVDMMRYEAPTAGYRNDFQTFSAPSPVPGLMIQTPYDAKAFNQACIKTGGANPVALDAGIAGPLKIGEITTRSDFDGTKGLLPMKFGGKRRNKSHRKSHGKSHKKSKKTRRNKY